MPRIADDAEVGRYLLAGKDDILELAAAGQASAPVVVLVVPRRATRSLEPQPIVPSAIATPADHLGGSVVPVGEQDHGLPHRQPAGDHFEHSCVAKPMAPSVCATRHASGKARSPQRTLSIRIWW